MNSSKYKLIVFDMDGVLFKVNNFWMKLHEAFGTLEEGQRLTDKYLKSDYGKLVEEVVEKLWKGKDIGPYLRIINSAEMFNNVLTTFHELKKKGLKIAVITCGPKQLLDRLKVGKNYIDHEYSNDLVLKEGKVAGQFDWPVAEGRMRKVVLLQKICRQEKISMDEVIGVADGKTDLEMLEVCGKSIAFCPTSERIKESADVVIEKDDLLEVLKHV